ncbi:MAG: lipoyl domain-containing protein [Candidatus Bipolaricaulaceae bacterium]
MAAEEAMELTIPDLGAVQEVTFLRWLKGEGDAVEVGEAVAEVEADKAVFVIEAPAAGVLRALTARAGQRLPPGAKIGEIQPE